MTQTKLITMDARTLLTTPLPPTRFIIGGMLPQGLHILAGTPKIGKSWLALMICLRVTCGETLWDFPVSGDVVYIIKSESLPNTRLDMVDTLIALIKRDLEQGIKPPKKI